MHIRYGFAIIKDKSEYTYKVDAFYNGKPENNGVLSFLYDASKLNIKELLGGVDLILSDRDIEGVSRTLETLDTDFVYRG